MRAIKTIKDPECFQLLANPTRRNMVKELGLREMTARQMAKEFNLTHQAVYRQIKRLSKAGLVEVSREVRLGNFIERWYRAVAKTYRCSVG